MIAQADARALPFRSRSFDVIFTSPPWDHLDVLMEARDEGERVLKTNGRWIMVLPHLDYPDMATLMVANRDWTVRRSFACEKPLTVRGSTYFSMSDEFVRKVFGKFHPRRVLDPFCGTATVPRVARSLGINAVGCDLVPEP